MLHMTNKSNKNGKSFIAESIDIDINKDFQTLLVGTSNSINKQTEG